MSLNELNGILKKEKLVFGSERTLKLLKNEKLKKIFLASNCKEDIKEEIKKYAKIFNVEVIELESPNDEIGVLCKKPFSVSVLSY